MFFWQTKKVKATAPKLITKTEVVDDRRQPRILFNLNDGRELEVRADGKYEKMSSNNFLFFIIDQNWKPDGAGNCHNRELLHFAPGEGSGGDGDRL